MKRIVLGGACVAGLTAILLSTRLVAGLLMGFLQTSPALTPAQLREFSGREHMAIVVLSAGQRTYAPEYGGVSLDDLALERVRYGATVARATGLPLLVTGGIPEEGKPSHAEVMAKVLIDDYGLKAAWLEPRSRNTAENAIFSAAILKQAGVDHILLVTHAWHMPRSLMAFRANGLMVTPAPTAFYKPGEFEWDQLMPHARTLRASYFAIHEMIGIPWYSIRYGY